MRPSQPHTGSCSLSSTTTARSAKYRNRRVSP
jgi:hypothetical protein